MIAIEMGTPRRRSPFIGSPMLVALHRLQDMMERMWLVGGWEDGPPTPRRRALVWFPKSVDIEDNWVPTGRKSVPLVWSPLSPALQCQIAPNVGSLSNEFKVGKRHAIGLSEDVVRPSPGPPAPNSSLKATRNRRQIYHHAVSTAVSGRRERSCYRIVQMFFVRRVRLDLATGVGRLRACQHGP